MRIPSRDDLYQFVVDREIPLLRLLYFSPWLRVFFVLVVGLVIGVPLSVGKLWRVTPDDFSPEIKVSLLDKLQSWALYRSAKSARAVGEHEKAVHAWRSAIANDPMSVEKCREFLRLLVDVDQRRQFHRSAIQNAYWLLRINQTNRVDLEAVTQTFSHYEFEGQTLELLARYEGPLSPRLKQARIRALFLQGRIGEFAQQWEELDETVIMDPEMRLFHVAYLAGWGEPSEVGENLAQLHETMQGGENQDLAHRLNLFVSFTRLDADGYRDSLAFLESRNLDRSPFHINYWKLLGELDRQDEAIELATRYPIPPRSASEATQFAEIYIQLGLRDLAFRFLQRYATDYASYEGVWYTQAEILIAEERWDDLFFMAVRMRDEVGGQEHLAAYSFYLEGRAEMERGRPAAGQAAFRSIKQHSLVGSRVGLHIASKLIEWEFFEEARDVLVDVQDRYRDMIVYWELLFTAGNKLASSRDLLAATENIYRLRPNDFAAQNNFAAMLLSLRIRPDQAISLTFRAMNQDQGNPSGVINHAHSLLLNQRVEEAATLLSSVNEKPLIQPLKHGYYLAWLEIEFLRGNFDEAALYRDRVDQAYLLPGDRERYLEIQRALEQAPGSQG